LDTSHFLQFLTKNSLEIDLQITYDNKQSTRIYNTKFLGLAIDAKFSWGLHIDEIVTKLNRACYVVRTLKSFLSLKALRMIYFSSVHLIVSYGIIFWGASSNSKVVFKIQKRIIRIIMNSDSKASCHEFFKKLYILPLYSKYIFSILLFIVKNRPLFNTNSDLHNFNTRTSHDLHPPTANLTLFKKGVCYLGVEVYNHLPSTVMQLSHDVKKSEMVLRGLLVSNSSYSLEEHFNWK
jgi:hypothetical protein